VTDPRDKIDSWLDADVEPLPPPPGAFGLISRQARRRKASRALVSAVGAVALIAAAVALPHAAQTLLHRGTGDSPRAVAAGASPHRTAPSPGKTRQAMGGATPETHSATIAPPATSSLSAGNSGGAVPRNFQPTSVTFINMRIGAVIGQAGTPGHCATPYCTSLAGTSDYGTSWYGVTAPVNGAPSGASGVSQIRFLNLSDGWAFGPGLWVTHDGGAHWTPELTSGLRVTDLETADGRAFAIFASCTGDTATYAAHCGSFSLFSSLARSDRWLPVSGPAGGLKLSGAGLGHPATASLLLAAGTGYLLAPSGQIYSGPLTGAAWTVAGQAPNAPGAPGPDGQPTTGLLAARSSLLFELCARTTEAGGSQAKSVYSSADGGKTWRQAGTAPPAGIARSLAAAQGNLVVLATTAGLAVSNDGGATWTQTETGPRGAAAGRPGFSYVGMTDHQQGVAVPADPQLREVFTTTDGGATWQARPVQG
jgi:hypothetical protein